MDKLEEVAQRMYWALRSRPCNCVGRFKIVNEIRGVWTITKVCSRCVAMAAYELLYPQNDKSPQSGALDVPGGLA